MHNRILVLLRDRLPLWLLYAAPPLLALYVVVRYGVDVPYRDEWALVGFLDKLVGGTAGFADFFAQHNEHRILVPRLIVAALTLAFGWNVKLGMCLSAALALVVYAAVLRLAFAQAAPGERFFLHLANVVCGVLIFSLVQAENWLWGIDLAWFLVNACVVLAVLVLALAPDRIGATGARLWLAGTLCLVASFTMAQGLLAWLALLPMVGMLPGTSNQRWGRASIWLGVFVACLAVYMIGYWLPPGHPDPWYFLGAPHRALRFLLTLLGAPLAREVVNATLLGAVLLAAFLWCGARLIRRRRGVPLAAVMPWFSLGLFALLFTGMVTLGRGGMGVGGAMAGRYTTSALLLGVAVVQLLRLHLAHAPHRARAAGGARRPPLVWALLGGMLLSFALIASGESLPEIRSTALKRQQLKVCLELTHYVGDLRNYCLSKLHLISPRDMLERIAVVERAGLRRVPRDLPFVAAPQRDHGVVDRPVVTGAPLVVRRNETVKIEGWAVLREAHRAADLVLLSYGEETSFFATAWVERESGDVAHALHSRRYARARWAVEVPAALLPVGEVTLKVWVYDPYGRRFVLLKGQPRLTVVEK